MSKIQTRRKPYWEKFKERNLLSIPLLVPDSIRNLDPNDPVFTIFYTVENY